MLILLQKDVARYVRRRRQILDYFLCSFCGNKKVVWRHSKTISCGCKEGYIKHNKLKTVEYNAWVNMRQRCYNPKKTQYADYGGRGIIVCDRWLCKENGFINFYADMGPRPSKKHSIDRINNNGNYEPSNCRWATFKTQGKNKRRSPKEIIVNYEGKKHYLIDLCKQKNLKTSTIRARIYSGWSIKDAIEKPKRARVFK